MGPAAGANAGFFRHPPTALRPPVPGMVVAAADGQVCLIDTAPVPANSAGSEPRTRISVFLSLFDAHVQRSPVSGEVLAVEHRPGVSIPPNWRPQVRTMSATAL